MKRIHEPKEESPTQFGVRFLLFEVCKAILIFDWDVCVHERNERGNEGGNEGRDTKSALHVIVLIHHIEAHENKMCIYEHKIFFLHEIINGT